MIRLCIWGLLRFTLATLLFCVAFSVVLPTVASAVTNAKGDTAVTLSPSKNLETISLALGRPINAQVFMVDGPPHQTVWSELETAHSRSPSIGDKSRASGDRVQNCTPNGIRTRAATLKGWTNI